MEILRRKYNKITVKKIWLIAVLILYSSLLKAQLTSHIYDDIDRLSTSPSPVVLRELETKEIQYATKANSLEEYTALLILQCNMGYYYRENGAYLKAIALYEKAWQNYRGRKIEHYDITEFCLKPLGNLYTISGDLTRAENTIKSYLFIAQQQNDTEQETAAILNLSVVYHNAGNFRMAARLLETQLSVSSLASEQKTSLLNNLAANYFALKQYDAVEKTLQKVSKTQPQIAFNLYRNAAQLAKAKGELSKAENYLDRAENELLTHSLSARELARIYVEKAELASLNHQYPKAKDLLFRALNFLLPQHRKHDKPTTEMLYAENVFISVFDAMAALQSEPEKSLEYYELSFHVSKLIRTQIITQEAALLQLAEDKNRSEKCIALLYDMYRDTGNPQYMERAFHYSENNKASILKKTDYRKSIAEAFPDDPLLSEVKKWSAQQEQLINKLVRAQLSGNIQGTKHYTEALNDTQLQLGALYKKAYLKYPSMINPDQKISLDSIRQLLRDDQACMVIYFSGKKQRFIFSVSSNSSEMYREDNTVETDNLIRAYLSLFEDPHSINNNPSDYAHKAHSLFNKLFPFPISEKKLIVVPDGLLSFIPIETLLTSKSESVSYKTMPFLLYRHQVSYLTSASFYHRASPPISGKKLLGIFPVFEGTPEALPYSLEEAQSIKALTEAAIITGKNATKSSFVQNAKNYGILHLSTHSSGGNFVVPPSIAFSDDTMLLHELYSLEFKPKLVVLSACETGIGKIQKGEGPISIARGFQYAGAKQLLFSLWKVNDRATAQLMTSFYRHCEKYGAATANRKAKTDYLADDKISNIKKSPYYWGAFVYYGNLQQKQTYTADYQYAIFAILIVTFAVLLIYLNRRKQQYSKSAKANQSISKKV